MTDILTEPTIKKLRLADIADAPYNPRHIADAAFQGLRDSLKAFGMLEMPVVNTHGKKLRLISGHQRVAALKADGVEWTDCIVVDFDTTQEKVANLTMNNPAIRGTFDVIKAADLIPDLSADLPSPNFAGFDKLLDGIRDKADRLAATNGAEAGDKTPKVTKPKSKPGTVYKLGRHRIYCGDFDDGLTAMLGKKKADLCVTDPPYNVAYESASGDSIKNDEMTADDWRKFMARICKAIVTRTKGVSYVFMSSKELPSLFEAWEKSDGAVLGLLVWAKDRFTLSRSDYHHQHEPILLGCPNGATPEFEGLHTNVIECPKPSTNNLHPTQKPTALIRMLLEDASSPGDVVIDPFCGSGTTLMVAEELGLTCYASDLDPRFVDVVRKRWAEQVHGEGVKWVAKTPSVS